MTKKDKIKVGVAVGVLAVAGGLVYWQLRDSMKDPKTIDPERRIQELPDRPVDPDGKPRETYGNRGVPPKR